MRDGSIVFLPWTQDGRGRSEYHAELLISEVLKGRTVRTSMVVRIHYGLDAVSGGYMSNQFQSLNVRGVGTNYPKDVVEIFDTGIARVVSHRFQATFERTTFGFCGMWAEMACRIIPIFLVSPTRKISGPPPFGMN